MKEIFRFILILPSLVSLAYSQWSHASCPVNLQAGGLCQHNGKLFVGTFSYGICYSNDCGSIWNSFEPIAPFFDMCSITCINDTLYSTDIGGRIYTSTNDGTSWTTFQVVPSFPPIVRSVYENDGIYFAATDGGVYRSTDNGKNWSIDTLGAGIVMAQAFIENKGKIFLGSRSGLFSSSNNGLSWNRSDSGLPQWTDIGSFVLCGNAILAGTRGYGVYISKDGGISWSPCNINLPVGYISQLLLYNNILFCAATTWYGSIGGVYSCDTSAFSWRSLSDNLSNTDVQSIIVSGNNLVISTNLSGMFYRDLSTVTSVTNNYETLLPNIALWQNYPNPFNPSTTISFALPSSAFVTLKIFDNIGREIVTLISKELSKGFHSYLWNASNVSSGVYYYRLYSGQSVCTKKIMVLK
ncbi:MAG: T9SS type A sorting domain-containing protein [Bacteroidota bacterium]